MNRSLGEGGSVSVDGLGKMLLMACRITGTTGLLLALLFDEHPGVGGRDAGRDGFVEGHPNRNSAVEAGKIS